LQRCCSFTPVRHDKFYAKLFNWERANDILDALRRRLYIIMIEKKCLVYHYVIFCYLSKKWLLQKNPISGNRDAMPEIAQKIF
jgi:hypothetical protein